MLGIIFVLDRRELVVVCAIEVLLPVGIAVVAFGKISGSSGGERSESRRQLVGNRLECILHRI